MRILIYSVSAGAGHVRAAEAIAVAYRRYYPDVVIEHVDVMKLVPSSFRRAYCGTYHGLISRLPHVWGWLYRRSDSLPQNSALGAVRKFFQGLNTSQILEHALDWKPDAILTTHFLPAEIFSDYLKKTRSSAKRAAASLDFKLGVVVTDHDVHQLWIYPNVDRYYTASEEIKYLLDERSEHTLSIKATGIPCDPAFGDLLDQPARERLRKILGLNNSPPRTLLMNAHGCGVTGAAAARSLGGVLSNLLVKAGPLTILVICGRNPKIKDALSEAVVVPAGSVVKFYDYVSNMHELMGIADLTVCKPGGLTSSECLARCLPMVLVSPIPGQEDRNAEMLLEHGCAVIARTPAALSYKMQKLLKDADTLQTMRENCKRTGRPNAAREIAGDMAELARANSNCHL